MQPSKDYYKGYDAAEKNYIRKFEKIVAEIEEYKSRKMSLAVGVDDLEKGKQIALEYVLTVLDKYKSESEDKEWE